MTDRFMIVFLATFAGALGVLMPLLLVAFLAYLAAIVRDYINDWGRLCSDYGAAAENRRLKEHLASARAAETAARLGEKKALDALAAQLVK